MISAPVIVTVWEADNAIEKVRSIVGATEPGDAREGTLIQAYGNSKQCNLVHASDAVKTAAFEIPYFFKETSLFFYRDDAWKQS